MARSYTIKTAVVHQYMADPVRYATNIQYQVCDEVTTVESRWNHVIGSNTDQTMVVRTLEGSVETTCLTTGSNPATHSEIRSHLDSLVGV